ncbi:hypothetical protein Hanom_Chr14g01263591 [Helianthus anomalus]
MLVFVIMSFFYHETLDCCLYKWLGLQLKAQQYMLTNNNIERENLFFAGSGYV